MDPKRNSNWQDDVAQIARGIRRRVLEHTIEHGGYMSEACSAGDILAWLYGRQLQLGPSVGPMIPPAFSGAPGRGNPSHSSGASYHGAKAPSLDRFIVSPTHYALTIYAALIEVGRLDPEGLKQFNQDGSTVEMIGGNIRLAMK